MKRDLNKFAGVIIGLVVVVGMGFGPRVALAQICQADEELSSGGVDADDCVSCAEGYINDGSDTCILDESESESADTTSCPEGEVETADGGLCECADGYEEDETGTCIESTSDGSSDDATDGCEDGEDATADGDCVASTGTTVSTTTSTTTTSTSATHALTNPLGSTDLRVVIGYIIKALLGLSGAIALFVFVWSGIMMMLAAGSPEKIKTAKASLTWATIGLVVIFTAYTLVYTLITALSTGTTT